MFKQNHHTTKAEGDQAHVIARIVKGASINMRGGPDAIYRVATHPFGVYSLMRTAFGAWSK